jgi:hypothetical protein
MRSLNDTQFALWSARHNVNLGFFPNTCKSTTQCLCALDSIQCLRSAGHGGEHLAWCPERGTYGIWD